MTEKSLNGKMPVLLLDKMVEILLKEGLYPHFDEGEVRVNANGLDVWVGGMDDGYVYVRAFVGAKQIPVTRITRAANAVMEKMVAIRVIFLEESEQLAFSAESYCKEAEVFREYFGRSIKLILSALDQFVSELCDLKDREEAGGDADGDGVEAGAAAGLKTGRAVAGAIGPHVVDPFAEDPTAELFPDELAALCCHSKRVVS